MDLWDRLRAAQAAPPEPERPATSEPEPAPEGWSWTSPLVAERRFSFSLEPAFWNALQAWVDPETWQGQFCFDTETTGLSGGAGTVAFLVGWAHLLPTAGVPQVEIRQWFLRDLPGEFDLVVRLDEALREARGLVSFNGSSFDLPLLRSRWSLSGREFPQLPHRDDLYPARRLWKRLLDSCRLSRLEETVLGIRRPDDVPGSLVPALWYDYLRRGASPFFTGALNGVLRHHAQDLYSLLCLDLLLGALQKDPEAVRWKETFGAFPFRSSRAQTLEGGLLHPDLGSHTPVDFWGLLELRDGPSRDRRLRAAWENEGTEALGLAWAARLKTRADHRARDLWRELWERHRSYPALEELLKWLEHRVKTPEARREALDRIEEALAAPFLPRLWRESLEKRKKRLAGFGELELPKENLSLYAKEDKLSKGKPNFLLGK